MYLSTLGIYLAFIPKVRVYFCTIPPLPPLPCPWFNSHHYSHPAATITISTHHSKALPKFHTEISTEVQQPRSPTQTAPSPDPSVPFVNILYHFNIYTPLLTPSLPPTPPPPSRHALYTQP